MSEFEIRLKSSIRDVKDFPKPGILFKDISTVLMNPELSNEIVDQCVDKLSAINIDKVAGIESRGFIFGQALAMRLNVPFVMIRKEGKLPYNKIKHSYDLEYGSAVIEVHEDAFEPGDNVLIHDDLLATGGTAEASAKLVEHFNAKVSGFLFLIDLSFLNGQAKLTPFTKNIIKLATY